MSETRFVTIDEWTPDIRAPENLNVHSMTNLIPTVTGYRSIKKYQPGTSAVHSEAKVRAFSTVLLDSGRRIDVVGTNEGLFFYRGASFDTWQDISPADETIAAAVWSFSRSGNKLLAATPDHDGVFVLDLTGKFDAATGDYDKKFTKIADPFARSGNSLANVRNFIVSGGVETTADGVRNLVAWSGLNNAESWTPSFETFAGYQPLDSSHGEVKHVVGGSSGIVFMDSAIYAMIPEDPPFTFNFQPISVNTGLHAARSVVELDEILYFYSRQGFMAVTRSGGIRPIGYGKVDEWVQETGVERSSLRGALDLRYGLVWWAYRKAGSNYEGALVYDTKSGKWGNHVPFTGDGSPFLFEHIAGALSPGITLDSYGSDVTLDSISRSLDDPFFGAERETFYFFDTEGKRGSLSSETPERCNVTFHRIPAVPSESEFGVIGDKGRITLAVVVAEDLAAEDNAVSRISVIPYDGPGTQTPLDSLIPEDWFRDVPVDIKSGVVHDLNVLGRYFNIELDLEALFTNLSGIRLDYTASGLGR